MVDRREPQPGPHMQLLTAVEAFEASEKLAAKDATQDLDG